MAQPATLEDALECLSDVQHQAVRHDGGALLVLAGPGSGKTRVLTTRIARLLRDTPDESFRVLALTFTNRAADEMRGRIERMALEAEHRLFIGTFHAFSAAILRQHGQYLGIKTDFRIYSTNEDRVEIAKRAIFSEAGRAASLEERHIEFLALVDRAKAKLIPCEGIAQKFQNAEHGARFEMFYTAYDAALREANALDFNSLIFNAHQLFVRFQAFAQRYRSVYRYWCVDEFQDTSVAQYELLKVMAGENFRNVFAVADDDQIIYQWNGADYRRLDQFRTGFDAALLQIPTNFRCPPEVVTCANKLIACNLLRSTGKKPLVAGREPSSVPSVIELLPFPADWDEARGIAQHIADHRTGALGQTAVLARVRRLLDPIADALTALSINCQVIVRRDEFQSAAFNWMQNTLRLAVYSTDERMFGAFVGTFNEMFDITLPRTEIIAQSQADRVDMLTGWHRAVREQIEIPDALALADAAVRHHRGNLDHARFAAEVIAVFEGWLPDDAPNVEDPVAFSALQDDRSAWYALSAEAGRAIGLPSDPEQFLQELDLRSKEPPVDSNTVRLMTIHGAKGNEFDHVYIAGLAEDVLPSFQSKKKGGQSPEFEEERRNCFVAVTRCQQTLTLSYAERYWGWNKAPSQFLREMGLLSTDPS